MNFNPLTVVLDKDIWRLGLFWGMMTCLFFFIIHQSKRIGLIASIAWAYLLGRCLMTIEYPSTPFGAFNAAFVASAGQAFAEALLIPMAVLSIPKRWMKCVWKVFTVLICIEIFCVWYQGYGVMIAPSFDTSLIAMFLPFAPIWLAVVSVITIITHHGSTAMMILIAQCAVLAFNSKKLRPLAIASIPLVIAAMIYHSHGPNLDGNERITVWKSMITHFWQGTDVAQMGADGHQFTAMKFGGDWLHRIIGVGPGSFLWLSIIVEPSHMFLSAHSEVIQIFFELGILGLILSALITIKAIAYRWDNPKMVAAILGVCACALSYHPLRFFPTALLICFIFRESFVKEK